jgi:HrpA-like RNA helicase
MVCCPSAQVKFDWMDPPHRKSLMRALELLYHLGALDENGKLTAVRLASVPSQVPVTNPIESQP